MGTSVIYNFTFKKMNLQFYLMQYRLIINDLLIISPNPHQNESFVLSFTKKKAQVLLGTVIILCYVHFTYFTF